MNRLLAQFPTFIRMQQRLRAMNTRERVLLSVFVAVVAGLVLVYGLLLPAYEYQVEGARTQLSTMNGLNWMKVNASNAKSQSSSNQPVRRGNELSLLSSTARLNDLKVQRLQPQDTQINVELTRQPYDSVIQWLVALETEHGFRVIDLRLEDAGDGVVDSRITLN